MNHIWVTGWVTDESYTVAYGCQMNHRVGYRRIVNGSQISHKLVLHESQIGHKLVIHKSQISHQLVTISNTTLLVFFSKFTNLWSRHNIVILRNDIHNLWLLPLWMLFNRETDLVNAWSLSVSKLLDFTLIAALIFSLSSSLFKRTDSLWSCKYCKDFFPSIWGSGI